MHKYLPRPYKLGKIFATFSELFFPKKYHTFPDVLFIDWDSAYNIFLEYLSMTLNMLLLC